MLGAARGAMLLPPAAVSNCGPQRQFYRPLGMNTAALGYSSPELAFLNIVKSGGQESGLFEYQPWLTLDGSGTDTGEEAYLPLDSDQYAPSLTASPTPPGGQRFVSLRMYVNWSLPTPPGASYPYAAPGTVYRLQFTGNGTITVGGDASASLSISDGATHSTTFTVATPSAGLHIDITAIGPTNYPTNLSIVENAYAAAYDAGAIFHPNFLAALAHISLVRPMQWLMNGGQDLILTTIFSGSISSGATSATLPSAWTWPTQTLPVVFSDGEQRSVAFTLGSSTATWSGALSATVSATTYSPFPYSSWSGRPQTTRVTYTTGLPYEVAIALANALGADLYLNVPLWFSDADHTAAATMVHSLLAAAARGYVGLSNEVWNAFFYTQFFLAGYLGAAQFPSDPAGGSNSQWARNYYGMRVAQMATIWQSVWGSDFSRVYPVLEAQGANTSVATDCMTTAYWPGGPASSAPIKCIAINPYVMGSSSTVYPSQTDVDVMTAQPDGGVSYFFALMHSNVIGGTTFSSIDSAGFFGSVAPGIAAHVSLLASTYPGVNLIAYEGGTSWNDGGANGGPPTGWNAIVALASRDARMASIVSNDILGTWGSGVGGGKDNIFVWFTDIYGLSSFGDFGVLESTQQTISPLTSAPAKFQGIRAYTG